jgi:phosphotriesterase-related protein
MIETVLGAIAPEDLGVCLPHEHIWCDYALAPRTPLMDATRSTASFMRLRDFTQMEEELRTFQAAGGGAIVEVTCDGWGRDLDVLARLSERTGVHIIATAGYYIEPCIPWFVSEWPLDKLADHMTREIEEGVGASGHKCGVLKSAIHRARIEGVEAKVLAAVAIVQKRTGVAITTHTTGSRRQEIEGGTIGVQQLQFLKAEGVPAERLIVGHVDERPDIDVLSALAAEGCFVQFDVISKEHWLLDATRAELITALIARGYRDNLMISHDCNRIYELHAAGGYGYCHIFARFLPRLRALGLSDATIDCLMIHNPARAFNR